MTWSTEASLQRATYGLNLHHHIALLDRHIEGFRHKGPFGHRRARLDAYIVFGGLDAIRFTHGLAGADVEFPAMPGTADDLVPA